MKTKTASKEDVFKASNCVYRNGSIGVFLDDEDKTYSLYSLDEGWFGFFIPSLESAKRVANSFGTRGEQEP